MNNRNVRIGLILIFTMMINLSCQSYKPYVSLKMNNSELQSILDNAVNEFKLPGVQAGILYPDGRIVLASSGTIDFKRKEPHISNENIFRVGSTTKMFVAALICRYVENGQLSFDAKIDQWFPNLPEASSITIKELLNQNSGIQENLFTKPSILLKSALSDTMLWDPNEVVNGIMKNMKITPVEERSFLYANNNYLILGLIAEKVGEDEIAALLDKEFFIPLKMENTYFLPCDNTIPDGLISGYDEYIPFGPHVIKPANTSWSSLTYAAGSMASTSEDLLIWLNAFFHNKVLKPETLASMRTYINARDNGRDNSIVGYGLGLAKYEISNYSMEGHPGGGFGGECFPFYFSEKDVAIVVSYNWSKKDNPAGKALISRIIEKLVN